MDGFVARLGADLRPWLPAPAQVGACGAMLFRAYGEEGRFYHNLDHLNDVLAKAEALHAPRATRLALWFHDAVYDSRVGDNEAKSAELAAVWLGRMGVDAAVVALVVELILLTKSHILPHEATLAHYAMLDADLAILAAEPAAYEAYAAGVRREYGWVAEAAYREGRGRVLAGFLARESIYHTAVWQARERVARANMRRELARLLAA